MNRILVIERDAKIRDLLSRFLGVKGYDVTATVDAATGMDRFIGERPDLILVDMQLPDMDGVALCRAVRDTRLAVALVLMGTARQSRRPEVEQARDELAIPQFLVKPFGVGALLDAIEKGLAGDRPGAPEEAASDQEGDAAALEPESTAPPEAPPPVGIEPPPTSAAGGPARPDGPVTLEEIPAMQADDPAESYGASSAGGLLTGGGSGPVPPLGSAPPEPAPPEPESTADPAAEPAPSAPDSTAARLAAVYAVDDAENHTWGLESLRMEAIRHGVGVVADDERRYALEPIVPQSPSDPRGIYGAVTVPNLLYRCFRDLFTGRVLIRRGPVRKVIVLANGRPIGAESNIRSESLGYLLLQEGLIDQRQLEHSGRMARQMDVRQGEALVRMGAIDAEGLAEGLRRQMRQRILSCFAWSGAEYGLTYEPDIRARLDPIELNPLVLIFDGIKTSFPIAPLVAHFDDCNRSPVSSTPRLRDYATMLRDFADELRVAALCDGQRTLGEVLAHSPYGLVDSLRILRALEITGCLAFADQQPPMVERAPTPRAAVGGSLDGSVSLTGGSVSLNGGRSAVSRRRRTSDGGVPRRTTVDVSVGGSVGGSVDGSVETTEHVVDRRRMARNRREANRMATTGPDLIKADANFAKGRRCLEAEDLENALAHFQLACKQDPHQQLFKMYRGWVRFLLAPANDRKARSQAHDEIKAALDADSNQDEGYVLLGNIYRTLGRDDKAMKLYRKALSLNRRNPTANRAIREMEGRRALEERDPQGLFGKFFTRR